MFELFNRYTKQKGAYLVFFAVLLPFLCAFAALSLDLGAVFASKSSMQNAADAAALAGAKRYFDVWKENNPGLTDMKDTINGFTDEESNADRMAKDYIKMNIKQMSRKDLDQFKWKREIFYNSDQTRKFYKVYIKDAVPMHFLNVLNRRLTDTLTEVAAIAEIPTKYSTGSGGTEASLGYFLNVADGFGGSIGGGNQEPADTIRGATVDGGTFAFYNSNTYNNVNGNNQYAFAYTWFAKAFSKESGIRERYFIGYDKWKWNPETNTNDKVHVPGLESGKAYSYNDLYNFFKDISKDSKDNEMQNISAYKVRYALDKAFQEMGKDKNTDKVIIYEKMVDTSSATPSFQEHAEKVKISMDSLFASHNSEVYKVPRPNDQNIPYDINLADTSKKYYKIDFSNEQNRHLYLRDDENDTSTDPVYLYIDGDFPKIYIELKSNINRPVFIYIPNKQDSNNLDFEGNGNGSSYNFHGSIFAPNMTVSPWNYEGNNNDLYGKTGIFKGSITVKNFSQFQSNGGHFIQEDFIIPGSGGGEANNTNTKLISNLFGDAKIENDPNPSTIEYERVYDSL